MSKPKIVRFDFDSSLTSSCLQNSSQNAKKIDEIILWDAYWEKQLIKNGIPQNTITKLRLLPHQKKINLILVFFFKHDNKEYSKEEAQFTLKIEVPNTLYDSKEFIITGKDLLNKEYFYTQNEDGKEYYFCNISSFTSDLINAQFPHPFKEK